MSGDLSVTLADGLDGADAATTLAAEQVPSALARQDPTLWGPAAADEAAHRLGWVAATEVSVDLPGEIAALREELAAEGVDQVVLCGMGGSSLAPEVITATAGAPLTVLDSTDPQVIHRVLSGDLARTVVVVSSKSGGTVETDSHRRAVAAAFGGAGIDAARRIVVVTDPDSPLHRLALDAGYRRVFLADPAVGGRYSALTAFGLVPSGLAGADLEALLASAAAVREQLAGDGEDNPAALLAAAMAGAPGRDKLAIADDETSLTGFADWAEQLIAESTGKQDRGVLPIAVGSTRAPEIRGPADDVTAAVLTRGAASDDDAIGSTHVAVSGGLGAQFLLWEHATALAGRLLGINPFDQPDVESAKQAARGMLDQTPEPEPATFVDGGIEVRGTPGLLDGVGDLDGAVTALLRRLHPRGYLAVMAYLDRERDTAVADVREPLCLRTGRPVTFGWGPRFLHSTGQYHKGGPPVGVFVQVTGAADGDVPVPERPFTFGELIAAQAAGDAAVLADRGRPVLRLHLTERGSGVARLREVLR